MNRQTVFAPKLQKIIAAIKGKRYGRVFVQLRRQLSFFVVDHETTPDRIINFLAQGFLRIIRRGKTHAVGMRRQRLIVMKNEMLFFFKWNNLQIEQYQTFCASYRGQPVGDGVRINQLRLLASQTQENCTIRAVPFSGQGE
ncbi:MAG: hypothetical protein ALAOOOJD_00062 [bacterium]|nr:hypothetical protein [bacterium]